MGHLGKHDNWAQVIDSSSDPWMNYFERCLKINVIVKELI